MPQLARSLVPRSAALWRRPDGRAWRPPTWPIIFAIISILFCKHGRFLRGLLLDFSLPIDDPAAAGLEDRICDLSREGGELDRLEDSGLKPTAAEAAALRE